MLFSQQKLGCLCPEKYAAQISCSRPFRCYKLRDHPAADWRAEGGKLRRAHQEHWTAAGASGDLWWANGARRSEEQGPAAFHSPPLFMFRLCWRLCQRCHRDPEHPDSGRRCLPQPPDSHLHGLPQAVHLSHLRDHQLQSWWVNMFLLMHKTYEWTQIHQIDG